MKHKNNSTFKAPVIILVRPQLAQNIGMVARAMMNCGISKLRLVAPRESPLSSEALAAASGAQVILEESQTYSCLEEAISDINYVIATTARNRGINKPVYNPEKAIQKIKLHMKNSQKVAILFGPERTGLENEDLIMADALLNIPLNPIHSSLNLAQAVLLIGWSWWQKNSTLSKEKQEQSLASKNELNQFLCFLIDALKTKNYFMWENKRNKMEQNLKNIFTKSSLSSAEIKTLYRVVKRLLN